MTTAIRKGITAHKKYGITYEERKGALKYVLFLKENEMVQSKHEDVQMAGHKGHTKKE